MSTSTIFIIFAMAVGLVVALFAAQGRGTKVTHIETRRDDEREDER